ncbi:bis(5'-nucleosyl)-tetraphosphatase PrpE [Salibacterium halotolerans]|uniref:Protein phosphatase n=1 Tax=Salibacterium halotolerans TaxID=1884432 RepID=A0A1I5TCV8_9BACI|nr:bis(5'-nucleosyl)-tetraphosphatase PrpE [Salibacterium halotolerans]SFP80256.1 protein phosphatase [Salibacterium halotolerans]
MEAFDFIGDVHGCYQELTAWFHEAGYKKNNGIYQHPSGRTPVFIGDLTDRGPDSTGVIRLAAAMVEQNAALYIPGNHCNKLQRYLIGRPVQITGGLDTTIEELQALPTEQARSIQRAFIKLYDQAPLYLRLDEDRVAAAHAGIPEKYIGQNGKQVKTFVLYGDITGEKKEDGTPVRRDWAAQYQGKRLIVYGHTPVLRPRMIHHTVNIDTGCVFGGHLTGLHYPEMTYTQVPSTMPYVPEKFRTFR